MSEIAITLPDGSSRSMSVGATGADLAVSIGPGLARAALVIEVNGEAKDLSEPLKDGAQIRIITDREEAALEHLRHSTAHVLAQAVLELWPGATFAGGPPIADGFYYDFELPAGQTFTDDDLVRIDEKMREIIAADQPFERFELPLDEALTLMAEHPYKRVFMELAAAGEDAEGEVGNGTEISFYRNTDEFVDMCRGPHVPSTGRLGHFKLTRHGGEYFRGSEKNPMLQRIYAAAFASKKELSAHLHRQEEAAKRDHRKLGVELDLFSFPEEIGSGLAVFHPKGGIIRRLMEDYSRVRHEQADYEFVYSPHITKSNLFETSGHLQWFADGMFPPMEIDHDHNHGSAEEPDSSVSAEGDLALVEPIQGTGTQYYLKPMNCPFHILIFKSRQRSYRELPLRMFEFGTVYRYEKSGVVHGLTRVRGMTQDDAHILTTKEQMVAELV
ncbi:MAG: threonine--tRNA ligase, partial [Microthrixaceae bacterium]